MKDYQGVFERYEKKYRLNGEQYRQMMVFLRDYMTVDEYGETTICNLYFDTPTYQLIRSSVEKPVYKEKLRLRTYGVPDKTSPAFVELKKKYRGIVYKRRSKLPYEQAMRWLLMDEKPQESSQIMGEIQWFCDYYRDLQPACALFYDRIALFGKQDPQLRVTMDCNIRSRRECMELTAGTWGECLLPPQERLMEIKVAGAMPLWLTAALDEWHVYPASFSKYGTVYQSTVCAPEKGGSFIA